MGQLFGLKVKGDSMEPKISDGDTIVVVQQPNCESGDIAVVMVNGDDATVKKVRKQKDGIYLIPNNPSYESVFYSNGEIDNLPVTIIGRVVSLYRSF